ncbi:MAG: diguanylate cyclase, partial [Prochloraceae cyanobacterium]
MPNYSRLILTISFICQIFLAVGLTGWFSLKRGEQAIYEVARELQDDLSDQIEARLYNLLHTAELIDRGLVSDLKSERINIKDDLSIEKYLTEYLKFFLNTPIDTIQYANEQGDYLGVGRLRDDSLVIKVRVKGDFHTYSLDSQGKRDRLLSIQPNYDPRVREWYQKALENKGETWSSVYTMFSHPSLGLTLSTPVYNNEGQLIGIIGTDLLLKDLSKFLKELEIGKTGRTLIVEQATGKIIADSFSQEFFINSEPNNAQRLQLEGDVAQALAPHFSKNLEETEREKNIVIVDNSEKLFVQISPFKDANGLNWLLISGVSEREFQGIAQKNFNSTIALCLKVLLFSSVVAALTNQFFVKLGLRLIELRTDNLTGLPNRALLIQRLNQALKQEQRLAVLLLNCDGFHKINNSLGHTGVDRLLIAVAESLKNCLEPSDLLARLEEDKFAVLSFNSDVNQAVDLAERIRKELTPPFLIDGLQIYINNRIGIAFKNTEDTDSEHLLRDAHTAMLEAQPAHGCFYQIFESTMHQKAVEILQLESELQTALVNQQFLVYYQPIVSLSTERVIGLEALVRWRHPVKGFISPVKFIPLAVDTGLILELGFWVLSQACQQITHWGYP